MPSVTAPTQQDHRITLTVVGQTRPDAALREALHARPGTALQNGTFVGGVNGEGGRSDDKGPNAVRVRGG